LLRSPATVTTRLQRIYTDWNSDFRSSPFVGPEICLPSFFPDLEFLSDDDARVSPYLVPAGSFDDRVSTNFCRVIPPYRQSRTVKSGVFLRFRHLLLESGQQPSCFYVPSRVSGRVGSLGGLLGSRHKVVLLTPLFSVTLIVPRVCPLLLRPSHEGDPTEFPFSI